MINQELSYPTRVQPEILSTFLASKPCAQSLAIVDPVSQLKMQTGLKKIGEHSNKKCCDAKYPDITRFDKL
jgi:hypothetical protein